MIECWHTSNPQFQGSPEATHIPKSATSECKMKTPQKKPSTPRKCRLCFYYLSYFLLFTATFRLAMPHSIKHNDLRYLCVTLEETVCFSVLTKLADLVQRFPETHICRKPDLWGQGQNLKISSLLSNASQMQHVLCPPFFPPQPHTTSRKQV